MWMIVAMAAASVCPGTTTPQVEACFAQKLDADAATMARYREAALDRIAKTEPSAARWKVVAAYLDAEKQWKAYRDADCGAVYENWSQGSIRGLMALQCKRRLTQQRTHAIWSSWLTFADNSPPVLPEPPTGQQL